MRKCVSEPTGRQSISKWLLIKTIFSLLNALSTAPKKMLNCHGNINEANYEQCLAETRLYGPKRVAIARAVLKALEKSEFQIFMESGTLLGAYRNGKMLPHDDDFDYGVYVQDEDKLMQLLESLKAHLDATLPEKYKVRVVSTYSKKVEVYEPEWGKYPFFENTTDYHNVTVDITAFVDDGEGLLRMPHYRYDWFRTRRENLFPLTTMIYEGESFPAPYNAEQVLKDMYGYIGEGAVYDPETKKYVPKDQPSGCS